MELTDNYTSYCIDEAASLLLSNLETGTQPVFKESEEEKQRRSDASLAARMKRIEERNTKE